MTATEPPSMEDLYPNGNGYHTAHEPYLTAVATAFTATGLKVRSHHADPNDPRDGAVQVDVYGLELDEVWAGWNEERGWWVLTIEKGQWGREDRRFVYDLGIPTVSSPESVVRAFAEKMGLDVEPRPDGHPDADFPYHQCEDDNVGLELALRRYAAEVTT